MNKPTLKMMIGLPASGKSYYAKSIDDDNTLVLSSDTVRKELFRDLSYQEIVDTNRNKEVFECVYRLTEGLLLDGCNVVIDATNLSKKRRKAVIDRFKKIANVNAVYLNTPYEVCLKRNDARKEDEKVPYDKMVEMRKTLQVPMYNEGFSHIEIITSEESYKSPITKEELEAEILNNSEVEHDELFKLLSFNKELSKMINLAQDSKYHTFSVSRHSYHFLKNLQEQKGLIIRDNSLTDELFTKLLWIAILHDSGKPFTKKFVRHNGEKSKYASFLRHENVSGQIALEFLLNVGYEKDFVLHVVELINYHMRMNNVETIKSQNKLIREVGFDNFNLLKIINSIDNISK